MFRVKNLKLTPASTVREFITLTAAVTQTATNQLNTFCLTSSIMLQTISQQHLKASFHSVDFHMLQHKNFRNTWITEDYLNLVQVCLM